MYRHARQRVLPLLLGGLGLILNPLAGCDNTQPAPAADKYQPSRPTSAGSLSHAVRRAPGRALRAGSAPAPLAPEFPVLPSPPAHLDETTRSAAQEYLVTLTRVNSVLQSITDPSQASDALDRIVPLADLWRASVDYLAMVPESAQREIRREYADQLREASQGLDQQVGRLADRPAYAPILTLVRDMPRFAADEPTPAPQPIHAGASSPSSEPD